MTLSHFELILRKSIPVVINSYNQHGYLANIIHRFRINHFENLVVVDNASDDLLTQELLNHLEKQNIIVIRYDNNYGPRHFHQSGLYKFLGRGYHFFTDPDLDFDRLADDFVQKFISVSEKFTMWKVGAALEIPPAHLIRSDLTCQFPNSNAVYTIEEYEQQVCWNHPMGDDLYSSAVDTTLHLFNPEWYPWDKPYKYYSGIRIAGIGYQVRHLPWYKNDILGSEEYSMSNNKWNTWKSNNARP
jgi:glycosyltransferase involved in cell wall biosynthesis